MPWVQQQLVIRRKKEIQLHQNGLSLFGWSITVKIHTCKTQEGERRDEDPHSARMEVRMMSKRFTEGRNSMGDHSVFWGILRSPLPQWWARAQGGSASCSALEKQWQHVSEIKWAGAKWSHTWRWWAVWETNDVYDTDSLLKSAETGCCFWVLTVG